MLLETKDSVNYLKEIIHFAVRCLGSHTRHISKNLNFVHHACNFFFFNMRPPDSVSWKTEITRAS